MNAANLHRHISGVSLALLIAVLGFLMFVRPHLGSPGGSAVTSANATVIAADSASTTAADKAFVSWKLEDVQKSLQKMAGNAPVSVTPTAGPANGVSAQVSVTSDSVEALGQLLATLGQTLYIDPSSGDQIRGNGPLYQIENLNLAGRGSKTVLTFKVTVYRPGASPSGAAPAVTSPTGTTPIVTAPATTTTP